MTRILFAGLAYWLVLGCVAGFAASRFIRVGRVDRNDETSPEKDGDNAVQK